MNDSGKSRILLLAADGTQFELNADRPTRIGRGTDNDIVLSEKSVSRHHATISIEKGRCFVQDLESQNGTFLGGRKIQAAQVDDGERIRFGDAELALINGAERTAIAAKAASPERISNPQWWGSRWVQGIAVVVVIAAGLALLPRGCEQNSHSAQDDSSRVGLASFAAGRGNFTLPNASPDFVGYWYGSIPATVRNPSSWGQDSNECGTNFYLAGKEVVMSIASYAGAGIEVTNMRARALDPREVVVEEDALLHDSAGVAVRDHERVEFALVSSDGLECTVTDDYYREPATGAVAQVVYHGALRRISSAEADRYVEQMKEHGMTEKAAVQAPVAKK